MSGGRQSQKSSESEAWEVPDDLVHEHVRMPLNDTNEVFIRLSSSGRRLAAFCICQRIRIGGDWMEAARADCSHGSVHIHYFRRDGVEFRRRHLRSISGFADVAEGYDHAAEVILDNWEDVARRF